MAGGISLSKSLIEQKSLKSEFKNRQTVINENCSWQRVPGLTELRNRKARLVKSLLVNENAGINDRVAALLTLKELGSIYAGDSRLCLEVARTL